MDWKLFFSTFALVFLAELGDKTQLTALAASAGSKHPWMIFVAASSALVMSTLIATLVGASLKNVLPAKTLKIAAAVLFIVLGGILLYSTLTAKEEPESAGKPMGAYSSFVLNRALDFEAAASASYKKLSEKVSDKNISAVLRSLAEEENKHADIVKNLKSNPDFTSTTSTDTNAVPCPTRSDTEYTAYDAGVLNDLIKHEYAEAEFYTYLAGVFTGGNLPKVFKDLAEQERSHAKRLKECLLETKSSS